MCPSVEPVVTTLGHCDLDVPFISIRFVEDSPFTLTLLRAATTFQVPSGGANKLTSGTCQFTFSNVGQNTVEFCWALFVCICLSSSFTTDIEVKPFGPLHRLKLPLIWALLASPMVSTPLASVLISQRPAPSGKSSASDYHCFVFPFHLTVDC